MRRLCRYFNGLCRHSSPACRGLINHLLTREGFLLERSRWPTETRSRRKGLGERVPEKGVGEDKGLRRVGPRNGSRSGDLLKRMAPRGERSEIGY